MAGIGVMIGKLGGNKDSVEAFQAAVGKTIAAMRVDDDANGGDGALRIRFTDGTGLRLYDKGRSCCESRYMRTDDDLSYHVGATLEDAEVHEGPDVEDEYGGHEQAFLHVRTSKGVVVVNTHNEHNGYYGGFWFVAAADEPPLPAPTESTPEDS